MKKTTKTRGGNLITAEEETLYVALELGKARWRVASFGLVALARNHFR